MHQCLSMPEVIELTARFAEDLIDEERWAWPSPSVALARTCRAFYEPASNVCWSHLRSFKPLLRLFFSNHTVAANKKGPMSLEAFLQVADSRSWTPFLSHARRVRKLDCRWTWDLVAYLKILHRFRPDKDGPLLPGLQALSFSMDGGMVNNNFPLEVFAHLGLQSITVVYHLQVFDTPTFDFLSLQAPRLQRLQVSLAGLRGSGRVAATRSFISLLPNLNHLTALLYVDAPLPAAALFHLANLPNLKKLNAAINPQSTSLLPSEDDVLFPALHRLWLSATGDGDVTRVLTAISSRNLSTLYMVVCEQPKAPTVAAWIELVGRHQRLSQLNIHSCREVLVRVQTSSDYIVDDTALRPLLELPRITKLGLRDVPLRLNDAFVRDMASSWPHLQELILATSVRWRTSGITMEGLIPLSAHCSELYLLAVSVNTPPAYAATTVRTKRRWLTFNKYRRNSRTPDTNIHSLVPTSDTIEEVANVKCKSLRYLDVGNSSLGDPVVFAAFISRYFPNVRRVSDLWDFLGSHKEIKKVNELLYRWGAERWAKDTTRYNKQDIHLLPKALFCEIGPMII